MCLGVPGQVVEIWRNDLGLVFGRVRFGGIVKEVNLSYTPDVQVGDYVVVHVGFAISRINEEEARRVFDFLRRMGDLEGLEEEGEREP